MKGFFWKAFVLDPAKPEHKEIVWAKVNEHKIDEPFIDLVVEAFHDKRAAMMKAGGGGGGDAGDAAPKNLGPVKKQFFSPEESKQIQMSLPKFPKHAEDIRNAVTTY